MPEVQHTITNGHCFLQLGSGGTVSPPVVPGQSPDGVQGQNPRKLSRSCSLPVLKMPKIYPRGPFTLNYNFMNIVD